jgi:hypothetical protein
MPAPAISTAFGDLLDPRFQRIFNEQTDRAPAEDMIPKLFGSPTDNGRADMRWSSSGAFGDFSQFTGQCRLRQRDPGLRRDPDPHRIRVRLPGRAQAVR